MCYGERLIYSSVSIDNITDTVSEMWVGGQYEE